MPRKRKKTWDEKATLTLGSFRRVSSDPAFASRFYENLFFLKPQIKEYFEETDFAHQEKALMGGVQFLFGFFNRDPHSRSQVLRIAESHSRKNLNIHPHDYYYWIEALIMTAKKCDKGWYDDLEYYWREVISFPVFFIISQYYKSD